MASFPTAVKAFATKNAGDTIQPNDVNDLQDEVNAIEAGLLNGTAPLNSSNSTVVHLSVTAGMNVVGNSTLGSSITLGTLPYIFPASGGSTGMALLIDSTSGSTMTLRWGTAGQLSVLTASTGTDSNAGATTVDSIAISGLTSKDVLEIRYSWDPQGGVSITAPLLFHVTDAVQLVSLSLSGNLSTASRAFGTATIMNGPTASTQLFSIATTVVPGAAAGSTGQLPGGAINTAWTAPWTLGLRHGGISAGSGQQAKWKWQVWKRAGQ